MGEFYLNQECHSQPGGSLVFCYLMMILIFLIVEGVVALIM